ncbi:MAG: hypothetical protein IIC06_00155 [Proteobacteria bacterium]|nr:hypothetical protein [Pseudomonadota bacterium]
MSCLTDGTDRPSGNESQAGRHFSFGRRQDKSAMAGRNGALKCPPREDAMIREGKNKEKVHFFEPLWINLVTIQQVFWVPIVLTSENGFVTLSP